jgi:quinol monooxygenase YgiN
MRFSTAKAHEVVLILSLSKDEDQARRSLLTPYGQSTFRMPAGGLMTHLDSTDGIARRAALAGGLAVAAMAAAATVQAQETKPMYGLIGQMKAAPGKRDDLVAILAESTEGMPGCLSYIVARDAADADALWITEVWTDKENHAASLQLPAVQAAIAKARPIIAGFGHRFETVPIGGVGLAKA